jgi:hypothetical protein
VARSEGIAREGAKVFRDALCKAYREIVDPLVVEALTFDAIVFAQTRTFDVRLWETRRRNRLVITHLLK